MLLTLTTARRPATDLGFLLHKHPDRFQSFALSFGAAHVFYPEAAADRCSACLLLDVDPVGIVRGRGADPGFTLKRYVNDRPYTASSFLSVAIGRVFGSALRGQCKARPELADERLPLTAAIDVLPVRGGDGLLRAAFEPLGYAVEAVRHPLDETFPDWGDSPYFSAAVSAEVRLADLLSHLYVLVPALAGRKHYFVGDDEVDKLVDRGGRWLPAHPLRDEIARRYLHHRPDLVADAGGRLAAGDPPADDEVVDDPEASLRLNDVRLKAVAAAVKASGGRRVVDLGCGEGGLIRELLADPQFDRVVGVDVSPRGLAVAARRLGLDRLPPGRVELWQGSVVYRDRRLEGFDAAACVEVVEHIDPGRRPAFERVVFELARPRTVVLTTPNREYNAVWGAAVPAGRFRHPDHRFEWDRAEFRDWANGVAVRFGYACRFVPIGPEHADYGPPTQMAVFDRTAAGG